MNFKGLLIKESLENEDILDEIKITKEESWQAKNPADYQPKNWTVIFFEGEAEKASKTAVLLSSALKPKWYASFSTENEVYVVFLNKIFKYRKGDFPKRKEIENYARSLGIPDNLLDWEE